MIELFNINTFKINTKKYNSLLHDSIVTEFEQKIANYVGAKYAVSVNSATSAIFLALQNKNTQLIIPSMIPPVVLNAIITSGNTYKFIDNPEWVGNSYILHKFDDYKIIDSAQKLEKNQFITECNDNDLMIFSFYPTKPIGSCDGGLIVSNNEEKINYLKTLAFNGMSYSINNWERIVKFPGYKMYMNSIQAHIALNNFKKYEEKLKKLEKIRNFYNTNLGYSNTSTHLYRIKIKTRNDFITYMKNKKITCGIHYNCAHLNDVYKLSNSICPLSEHESSITVSIPYHEKLSINELQYIIKSIKNYEI